MGDMNLASATSSDMENRVDNWAIEAKQVDSAYDQPETEWINPNWNTYWGYFNEIPELKNAILMKAAWIVGKGYTVEDLQKEVILDNIKGWGKDSFRDILFNLEVIRRIGGDAFAEIIRDKDTGFLENLKPIDPGTIKIIIDRDGMIKRYEQITKTNKTLHKFQPEDILHLTNNRLADQIHGISDIVAIEKIIKANAESFEDMQKIMHRQARPMIMFKLGTDNQAKIDAFVAKMDKAVNKGENIYVPNDKDSVDYEVVQVNISQLLLSWRDDLRNSFYRTVGLPQIVPGGGGQSTESESKVIYLAFEQLVEHDQKYWEEQLWQQLGIKINLIHPASIEPAMQTDERKDAMQGLEIQPSDFQAGVGR